MRWWDVEQALVLERALFPGDAWTAGMLWSELAGVPDSRWYVVADVDGALAGYAGLYVAGADADVQTVAVAPGRQGHGLGRRLLDALLDEARRRGCTRVTLEVRADNAPAHALYAGAGFEKVGVRRGYYPGVDGGPPVDADVLQLRLRGPGSGDGGERRG